MARKPGPLLTKKKAANVEQFKRSKVKGKPLEYNASVEEKYVKALSALVRMMISETERQVKALFETDSAQLHRDGITGTGQDASIASQARKLTNALARKFSAHFAKRAKGLAEAMVSNVNQASKSTLHGSLKELSGGLSLETSVLTGPLHDVMKATVTENVGLIKSIASEYQTKVQGSVMRSITTGNGLQDLTADLEKLQGMTQRRAKNIALDQTRKAYNGINRGRMQALGIKKFEWLHSAGGQNPRPDHVEMSGNVYSFDNLPVIDERTGERGIPGQAPNCRCRMVPVLEFDRGET